MAGKTFRFSLQRVLDLREREAEEAERALARAVRARREKEEVLAAARRRRAEACAPPATGPLDPAALRRRAGFLDDLRRAEGEAARQLDRLRRQEAEARRALMARRRPEEALRVLRDNEATAHRRAQDEAELAFLDEQAVAGHTRKQRTAHA
jgi:flagellar FliJ protein